MNFYVERTNHIIDAKESQIFKGHILMYITMTLIVWLLLLQK